MAAPKTKTTMAIKLPTSAPVPHFFLGDPAIALPPLLTTTSEMTGGVGGVRGTSETGVGVTGGGGVGE